MSSILNDFLDVLFPRKKNSRSTDGEKPNPRKIEKLNMAAKIGVLISIALLGFIIFVLKFIGVFISISSIGLIIGTIIVGAVMRRQNRRATWLYYIAPMYLLLIIGGLAWAGSYVAEIKRPRYEIIGEAYGKLHPGQAIPEESFFGFRVGVDTFDEVVAALKEAKANFKVLRHELYHDFKKISITSYAPIEKIGRIGNVSIDFCPDNKIYRLEIKYSFEKGQFDGFDMLFSTKKMKIFNSAYYAQYHEAMRDSGLFSKVWERKALKFNETQSYLTPQGIHIDVVPFSSYVSFEYLPKRNVCSQIAAELLDLERKRDAEFLSSKSEQKEAYFYWASI